MITVKNVEENDSLVIMTKGRMGGEASIEWYRKVKEIIDNSNKQEVILDFKEIDFLDSSGLGALVAINSTLLKKNKSLIIRNAPESLMGLLKITTLDRVLNVQ